MQNGASPMGGNEWVANSDGTFSPQPMIKKIHYSDLDLYLMGLLPAEDVRPWFVVDEPTFDSECNPSVETNCDDWYRTPTAASRSQSYGSVTVRGTRLDYSIEDIVSRLGERDPPAGSSPDHFRIAFVLVADPEPSSILPLPSTKANRVAAVKRAGKARVL